MTDEEQMLADIGLAMAALLRAFAKHQLARPTGILLGSGRDISRFRSIRLRGAHYAHGTDAHRDQAAIVTFFGIPFYEQPSER